MDPRLAEIYGTNEDISDVEKTAAAELAEKLAEEGEMDIDGMTDEDVEALAQEVLSSDETEETEEGEKTASDETEEAPDTTEEKLAEADYIGRVMAHAYVQELKSIDKTAGLKDKAKAFGEKAKAFGSKAKAKASEFGAKAKAHGAKAGAFASKHKKPLAIGGAGLAAAGAAGMAYKHHKNKNSSETSALETLAQQRALEILAENGVDVNEKQAEAEETTKWDVLSQAVEAKAIEMLQAEGYEFATETQDEE